MTTGEQGRTPPDAENYLDLSGVAEETAGPHFDVVLRGYHRRQVDDHVAGLRRMVSQLRAQLAVRERRRGPAPRSDSAGPDSAGPDGAGSDTPRSDTPRSDATAGSDAASATVPEGGLPRQPGPDDQARSGARGAQTRTPPDMVGAFNDRLRAILHAAEQEAQSVRSRAAESLLAEHADSRAALADLRSQRDAVFDELMRTKARLDDLVSHAGRPPGPPHGARPWSPQGPGSGPSHRGRYPGPAGPRNGGMPAGPLPAPTWGADPGARHPADGAGETAGVETETETETAARARAEAVDADTAGDAGTTMVALEAVDPDAVLSRRAASDRAGDTPAG